MYRNSVKINIASVYATEYTEFYAEVGLINVPYINNQDCVL